MNKCHYKGEEFVPCEDALSFGKEAMDGSRKMFNFCPFCGESLKKREPDKPWWLVPGMQLKQIASDNVYTIAEIRADYIVFTTGTPEDTSGILAFYKLNGGPFDMVPEWATHIEFYDMDRKKSDRGGCFEGDAGYVISFPIWHNCPEEFKGKTFSLEGLK